MIHSHYLDTQTALYFELDCHSFVCRAAVRRWSGAAAPSTWSARAPRSRRGTHRCTPPRPAPDIPSPARGRGWAWWTAAATTRRAWRTTRATRSWARSSQNSPWWVWEDEEQMGFYMGDIRKNTVSNAYSLAWVTSVEDFVWLGCTFES